MDSSRKLLSVVESTLLGPLPPSPAQKVQLMHALRGSYSSLQSLLSYPPPKPSDRAQVQSGEVRLPDSTPISLDEQDIQIALKLSDDLHLNEIDSVRLLVSANQEWGLMGREPLDILRLAAGQWYMDRRDLITVLYTLLRAVVLDPGQEPDIMVDIQKFLEKLIDSGLRLRLMTLMKELNRYEPAGLGGPLCEKYVLDARGALVLRQSVVIRERLILGHCIVLSVLVVRTSPRDVKETFSALKDSAAEHQENNDTIKNQITFSFLFSLIVDLISDALSAEPDKASVLSLDSAFRREFHEIVMASVSDPIVEGFVGCVRLAWAVHLMLIQDEIAVGTLSNELRSLYSCLDAIFSSNVFQFLRNDILCASAYQNEDEDMIHMYNAYLHKLITCFLSHPLARDKVRESKEEAMRMLNSYRLPGIHDVTHDAGLQSENAAEYGPLPFVSLLEFVSEVYQKEPDLLSGNEELWTFVNFAGEDHTNFQTLVAFLKMLSTLASSQEGASKIYELLQGKAFRSVGWSTLFDCLTIYDEKFKQALQNAGALLPEFQEGDAQALAAYLNVMQKVMENGNPIERQNWFPDIEPLFKLLSYENVHPYVKGALRNAIATFVDVSPVMRDTIWRFLEQYDLAVVVGNNSAQPMSAQVYDMQFELNEIESRRELYPSTISYLNLLNSLIAEEKDVSDRGRRFIGIFRFICDHVFGPFPQRAYADPSEKWQMVVACLKHFHMILIRYDIQNEDIDSALDQSQVSVVGHQTPLQRQLPILELMKDFMSGKTIFRNIMGILMQGADAVITERGSQYGLLLEKAVHLSLEIIILVMGKDSLLSHYWRPFYQPLDVLLSQDHNQIVALLEYVRYEFMIKIQQCSIKIMAILSSRVVGLVQLLLKSNAAKSLVEDYAACLELHAEECQIIEGSNDNPRVLIMQLLIDNINRPAPNITHLLLKFDLDAPVQRTVLQPKFHYSCLKVILEVLDKLPKPDVNALLHEFGFQLIYELCLDSLTSGPIMDLLSNRKYQFFVKHLDTIGVAPLPKRNSSQSLRISSLHQRAWLLKILALELHNGYSSSSVHQEACQSILAHLFGRGVPEIEADHFTSDSLVPRDGELTGARAIIKSKVLELLEIVQFQTPNTTMKLAEFVSSTTYASLAEEILKNPASSAKDGGIYCFSERGDRVIDLPSFRDKFWQKVIYVNPLLNNVGGEGELMNDMRDTIHQLVRWGWKYNMNLEEHAAQHHMLAGWSQIVEVSVARRISTLENQSEILYKILDASLSASVSQDCSLRMAFILNQVALTCMAKLRDERFLWPGLNSDNVTCLDIILLKQLSNGACHSILFKLIMAILRPESSEALRRRLYALLLSYFQYCQYTLETDVPTTVLQFLLLDEQDGGDADLQKINREQAELARSNFSLLKKEAQSILDLVIKDATHGSEPGKTIALYVLDAIICVDQERFFLSQLQARGYLRSCLANISNASLQDGGNSFESLQQACTLEAELALLLRICHKYGKDGARILFSMGALEHIGACKAVNWQVSSRRFDLKYKRDVSMEIDRHGTIITPVLRLVYSLTSLVDCSDVFEVKNKIVREVLDFIKGHQLLFDQIIRQDLSEPVELAIEQVNLAVGIFSKVWSYEENDEFGFVQGLFAMMLALFSRDPEAPTFFQPGQTLESQRRSKLDFFLLCFNLSAYLYFLVTKKDLRLQVSESPVDFHARVGVPLPTLSLLVSLLSSITFSLERASEEKSLLLSKIQDINELSRQEVDEIIDMCARQVYGSSSDNIQARRYIAMVEMCQAAGSRDQLITLLLPLAENVLNIFIIHFEDRSITNPNGNMKSLASASSSVYGKLLSTLEQLELLSEDMIDYNLKLFKRLVSSLKETAIQWLAL